MLDPARFHTAPNAAAGAAAPRPVFRMGESDRMAGSVPVWDYGARAAAAAIETATVNAPGFSAGEIAYAAQAAQPEPFGFFDLLDMVNPLQHIPIVSTLYREITGDEIKPAARVIGGTIFGGPAGGAMSLANVIIEHETGRDLTGNVMAMVRDGDRPQWRGTPQTPEQRLDDAVRMAEEQRHYNDLSPHMMAFVAAPAPLTREQIAALPVIYIEGE